MTGRRAVRLGSALLAAAVLTGCGSESPRQEAARTAVEDVLRASEYDVDRTRCTDNPAPWFIEQDTDVFVCAAKRRDGDCDWYQATLKNAGWEVVLDERNAGCVLPF
jgi:hypothetical protein